MIRRRHSRTCTIVSLLLIAGMTSRVARADDGEKQQARPIRLYAAAPVGPIGTVRSLGAMKINGRALYGEQAIWRGDLIQVLCYTGAGVRLDSIGQITLASGANMTISTTLSYQDDDTLHPVLIASLIEGEIKVRLQPEASAYIETRDSIIGANQGACFRLRADAQNAQVDAIVGEVHVAPQGQTDRLIGHVGERDPNTNDFKITSKPLYVDPNLQKRSGVKIVRPKTSDRRSKTFMPIQDEPAKNILVRFSLEPQTIGQLDPQEAFTNDLGIAETTFTAGANRRKGNLIATVVERPEYRYTRKIVVGKPPGIFRKRNILIAAGAIGAIIIICCVRPPNSQTQDPPIIIEP